MKEKRREGLVVFYTCIIHGSNLVPFVCLDCRENVFFCHFFGDSKISAPKRYSFLTW